MEIRANNRWHRSRQYTACSRVAPKCGANECAPSSQRSANATEPSDAERKIVDAYKDLKPIQFQPPWAVMAWQVPTPPRPIIKQVIKPPDITVTGRIFDLFV